MLSVSNFIFLKKILKLAATIDEFRKLTGDDDDDVADDSSSHIATTTDATTNAEKVGEEENDKTNAV